MALGGLPIVVVASIGRDDSRKPNIGMWKWIEKKNGGVKVSLEDSFYCGDAAGRPGDYSDTDRKFARNVGVRFETPE